MAKGEKRSLYEVSREFWEECRAIIALPFSVATGVIHLLYDLLRSKGEEEEWPTPPPQ
ncbi:MAG: hypothetical protein UX68_C0012G0016 [Parcubacteria group bacterium GW2011_GWA2_46_9]|nr:MAG: hypothetical protein UX68_C0012G0016 [Parcubacteria group bacterium GW2011_GWA2_46_9]